MFSCEIVPMWILNVYDLLCYQESASIDNIGDRIGIPRAEWRMTIKTGD